MITISSIRHSDAEHFESMGGVGGFAYRPETTLVEWSDGTRLIVEDSRAKAVYKGTTFTLQPINTSVHEDVVEHWKRAISIRLQRDLAPVTRLQDRLRNWKTEWPDHDPAA